MSNIYVDTIRKTGGSLGTDIRIKNTSVFESDGGTSVTQNLVQGLAKSWASFDGGSDAIGDSFNTSGITDNGSADYSVGFTNNMGNANYSMYQCGGYSGNSGYTAMIYARATNEAEFRSVYDDNTLYEFPTQLCAMLGDLA